MSVDCCRKRRLHIAYFQSEAALPAALSMARDADQKAKDADQKAKDADQKASEANKRVQELEEKFQGEEFVNSVSVMSVASPIALFELQVQFFRKKT